MPTQTDTMAGVLNERFTLYLNIEGKPVRRALRETRDMTDDEPGKFAKVERRTRSSR